MRKLDRSQLTLVVFLTLMVTAGALFVAYWSISEKSPARKAEDPAVRKDKRFKARWIASYYGLEKGKGKHFASPYDIALDREGNIFVSDTGNSRIVKMAPDGRTISEFTRTKDKKTMLHLPLGIDIDDDGNIYLVDKGLSTLLILDKDFNLKNSLKEEFPILPVIEEKRLYLTTYQHISVYNLQGRLLSRWGKRGPGEGQFDFPNGLAVSGGKIFVSDGNNYRMQAFDLRGEFQWALGLPVRDLSLNPPPEKTFDLPAGLVADERGYLYLVDTFACNIRVVTPEGKEVAVIGDFGSAEGDFRYPHGIAYAGNRRFFIADRGNDRVQQLEISAPSTGLLGRLSDFELLQWIKDSWLIATFLYGLLILMLLAILRRYFLKKQTSSS